MNMSGYERVGGGRIGSQEKAHDFDQLFGCVCVRLLTVVGVWT